MSNVAIYCVVTTKKVTFCNTFADVVNYFEKLVKDDTDAIIEVYKWSAVGEGYSYYLSLSK